MGKILLSAAKYGFPKGVEASEQFDRDLERAFVDAASWLVERPVSAFAEVRAKGIRLQALLVFEMDQDQMEFDIPPELLLRLGERGIPLHMISND